MHEVAPVTAAARAFAARTAAAPATRVTVAIAPDVNREVAAAAWEAAVSGSPAAGARVEWRRAGHLLACLDCRADYPGDELDACPRCGGDGLVVDHAPVVVVTGWM